MKNVIVHQSLILTLHGIPIHIGCLSYKTFVKYEPQHRAQRPPTACVPDYYRVFNCWFANSGKGVGAAPIINVDTKVLMLTTAINDGKPLIRHIPTVAVTSIECDFDHVIEKNSKPFGTGVTFRRVLYAGRDKAKPVLHSTNFYYFAIINGESLMQVRQESNVHSDARLSLKARSKRLGSIQSEVVYQCDIATPPPPLLKHRITVRSSSSDDLAKRS
uniref:Sema domain-containing protein n=1 Tax=Angiostrongylus cantonensis TaxID=6313 RepID=A0A0K0DRC3_ANGCA